MTLPLFSLKKMIVEFILVYEQRSCNNYNEKFELKWKNWVLIIFLYYIKMSDRTTYYEINRETILNKAKEYYENNKEILRETARNKYIELYNEEKHIKREYASNRY